MNVIERTIRQVDAFQQRHSPLAIVYGVVKKYGNDNAGALTVQLTYSMFVTVFPLLLLLVTVLAIVLAGEPSARKAVLDSTFSQFPVVGSELSRNIHEMKRNSAFGLAIGVVGLIYGTTGLASTGLFAMEQIWHIPGPDRPGFVPRTVRSLVFLATLGVGVIVTTAVSSFGTSGTHSFWLKAVAEILAAIGNVAIYVGAFRVLTNAAVRTRALIPGAIFAGVAWTILEALGSFVVGHYLRGDNAVYGVFGTVLGLIAWIYLGCEVTIYAVELNSVLDGRFWPRGMMQPPLTEADQRTLADQAIQNQRRPEQEVVTRIWGRPMSAQEYLTNGTVDPSELGLERRAAAVTTPLEEPSPATEGEGTGPEQERAGSTPDRSAQEGTGVRRIGG